jgi:RimJ/RimL family protein N-acetyltransferase
LRPTDIDPYAAMCADPDVMRHLGGGGVLSRDDAWRQLAMFAGHWQLRGFGMWAVEERASGNFIGRVGLHFPDGWPDREIGWALTRASWGKGLAFEAASAALAHAFGPLQWPRIISLIASENGRSIRLAERLGEQFETDVEVRGQRVGLYSLERDAWRPAQPALAASEA